MRCFLIMMLIGCGGLPAKPLSGEVSIWGPAAQVDAAISMDRSGYFSGLESYGIHVHLIQAKSLENANVVLSIGSGLPGALSVCGDHSWDRSRVQVHVSDACAHQVLMTVALSHELTEAIFDPDATGIEIADPCQLEVPPVYGGMPVAAYLLKDGSCWPH